MAKFRHLLNWAENSICLALIIFFSFLVYLMIHQEISGGQTPSFGSYKLMIVMSGSMKPAFDTGSLIIVKKVDPYSVGVGEIITYKDVENTERLITHRVVDVVNLEKGVFFITKGDDNETRDFSLIPTQNVIGKVTGTIPYIGYLAMMSNAKIWVLLLVIIPVILAVIGELGAVGEIFRQKKDVKIEK